MLEHLSEDETELLHPVLVAGGKLCNDVSCGGGRALREAAGGLTSRGDREILNIWEKPNIFTILRKALCKTFLFD